MQSRAKLEHSPHRNTRQLSRLEDHARRAVYVYPPGGVNAECHTMTSFHTQLCSRRDGRVESGRLHSALVVPLPVSLFASDDVRTLRKYSPGLHQEANVNKGQYFPAGLTPDGAKRHGRSFVMGRFADAWFRRPSTQRSYTIVCSAHTRRKAVDVNHSIDQGAARCAQRPDSLQRMYRFPRSKILKALD